MEYKDDNERQQAILYNLERANGTLNDAILLATNSSCNSCANRLYYAAFYATTALLIKNDLYSKTHSGTKNLFNQYFIKTGIIEELKGYFYNELFDNKQEGDYATFSNYQKEDIFPMIAPTKEFIETLRNLIEEK